MCDTTCRGSLLPTQLNPMKRKRTTSSTVEVIDYSRFRILRLRCGACSCRTTTPGSLHISHKQLYHKLAWRREHHSSRRQRRQPCRRPSSKALRRDLTIDDNRARFSKGRLIGDLLAHTPFLSLLCKVNRVHLRKTRSLRSVLP